jgi:hypothetical protein
VSAMAGKMVVALLPDVIVIVVAWGYSVISWKLEQSVVTREEDRAGPSKVPVRARAQLSLEKCQSTNRCNISMDLTDSIALCSGSADQSGDSKIEAERFHGEC